MTGESPPLLLPRLEVPLDLPLKQKGGPTEVVENPLHLQGVRDLLLEDLPLTVDLEILPPATSEVGDRIEVLPHPQKVRDLIADLEVPTAAVVPAVPPRA